MMKMRKKVAGLAVMVCIAALTAVVGFALADEGGGCGANGGEHQQHDFRKYAQMLGLNDAQTAQAKALFEGNRDTIKPLATSLHAEREILQGLIHADTVDETAIRAETAKLAGIMADFNVNRAKMAAQFRAILTPPQMEILKTMHEKNGLKKHQPRHEADFPVE
jgi:Spy/CpxP family protein refolding chaperone